MERLNLIGMITARVINVIPSQMDSSQVMQQ